METTDVKNCAPLWKAAQNPPPDFLALVGGKNVAGKLPVISALLEKASTILLGGATAHTFLLARGVEVGTSEVDESCLEQCRDLMTEAQKKQVKLLLPVDHIAAMTVEPEVTIKMIKEGKDIPDNMKGLDIGFDTIEMFKNEIRRAGLVVWYGPLGVFEFDTFSAGTTEILEAVAESPAETVLVGEKMAEAVEKSGLTGRVTCVIEDSAAAIEILTGRE